MALINELYSKGSVNKKELAIYTILLSIFAPHVCEEVWDANKLGEGIVAEQPWPIYDENKCKENTIEIVVQLAGKIKARINVAADIAAHDAIALAKEAIANEIAGKNIIKEIYVPGKLVNIVAR